MKPLLYIISTLIAILLIIATYREDRRRIVIQMDGLLHWYRVENYEIDQNKCINFHDGMKEHVHFCGTYRIVSMQDFTKHEKGR